MRVCSCVCVCVFLCMWVYVDVCEWAPVYLYSCIVEPSLFRSTYLLWRQRGRDRISWRHPWCTVIALYLDNISSGSRCVYVGVCARVGVVRVWISMCVSVNSCVWAWIDVCVWICVCTCAYVATIYHRVIDIGKSFANIPSIIIGQ